MKTLSIPDDANRILKTLTDSGFEAFAVGGCVRDAMLGLKPHDWDFTTSALPDQIEEVFSDFKKITIGKRFGTIAVLIGKQQYEITTYRLDGDYLDSRHPEEVIFTPSLKEDLARRDFTVNAMAFSPSTGLVDPFDGARDLEYGVIRCVGEPDKRFSEDALRLLRALRFAAVYGFSIEPKTQNAILRLKDTLSSIAPERIREEFEKILCAKDAGSILRRFKTVFAVFIPELSGTFGFEQHSPHHNRDVFRHTVASLENIEPDEILRTTMLFHDIGKPMSKTTDAFGKCHYKGHPRLGAAMSEEIMRRLRFPNVWIDEVTTLIRHHDDRLKPDPVMLKKYLNLLGPEKMRKLLKVQRADILAQSMFQRAEKIATLNAVERETERILSDEECYNLRMLNICGRDLIRLGVSSGEQIGVLLESCLDVVIRGYVENEKDALIAFVKSKI